MGLLGLGDLLLKLFIVEGSSGLGDRYLLFGEKVSGLENYKDLFWIEREFSSNIFIAFWIFLVFMSNQIIYYVLYVFVFYDLF
jgi:hypothetical protein